MTRRITGWSLFHAPTTGRRQYAAGSGVVNTITEVKLFKQARQRLAPADSNSYPAGKRPGDLSEIAPVAAPFDDDDQAAVVFATDQATRHLLQVQEHLAN